jgi:DNA-binding LytR/AlgR family response regulator
LTDLEQQLGSKFFRAHRSCLVNLDHVAEIVPGDAGTHRIVFRDERRSSVPLSRRQARRLRELIPW